MSSRSLLARPRGRSYAVAGATALAALGSFALAWRVLSSAPSDPPGDGFAAGHAAGFGLAVALAGALVAADALALLLAELLDLLAPRQRLLVQAGCGASVLGTLLVVGFRLTLVPELAGGWVLLVLAGTAATALGTLWTVAARARRWLSSG